MGSQYTGAGGCGVALLELQRGMWSPPRGTSAAPPERHLSAGSSEIRRGQGLRGHPGLLCCWCTCDHTEPGTAMYAAPVDAGVALRVGRQVDSQSPLLSRCTEVWSHHPLQENVWLRIWGPQRFRDSLMSVYSSLTLSSVSRCARPRPTAKRV